MKKKILILITLAILLSGVLYPWLSLLFIDQIILKPREHVLNHPIQQRELTETSYAPSWIQYDIHPYTYRLPSEYTRVDTQSSTEFTTHVYKNQDGETIIVGLFIDLDASDLMTGKSCSVMPASVFAADYNDFNIWTINPFVMHNLARSLILKSATLPVSPNDNLYGYPTTYSASAEGPETGQTFAIVKKYEEEKNSLVIERVDCDTSISIFINTKILLSDIDQLVSSIGISL